MTDEPIISTKDRPGIYDAIETAKPDEPLFPIQGGDPFGPATVLHWVDLARSAGLAEQDRKKAEALLRKAAQAEEVAWAMMSYQRGEKDMAGTRATYSDDVIVGETEERRTAREAMIIGAGRLNNALAMVVDVADQLARHKVHPLEEVVLREAVEQIRAVALAIEPRRGRERS